MTLHYIFEIECDVQASPYEHVANGWYEPHCRREECEVDFDYDVDVTFEDFFDFICPTGFTMKSEEERGGYVDGVKKVFRSDYFDIDALEDDDDFIEFMTDRYQEDAYEACKEENE